MQLCIALYIAGMQLHKVVKVVGVRHVAGLQILPNGVSQLLDEMGRQNGEAYVQFAQSAQADQALLKHKERMGHRWGEEASMSPLSGGDQFFDLKFFMMYIIL